MIVFTLSLLIFGTSFSQSTFPSDSIKKFDAIRASASSYTASADIKDKFHEADRVLQRNFAPNKKMIIDLNYSTLYNVVDTVKSNYYVIFNDNVSNKLIVLWFRRESKEINPDFISAKELIAQIENAEENSKLKLEFEIIPAGARSSTFVYAEGQKLFIHAKLLAVTVK